MFSKKNNFLRRKIRTKNKLSFSSKKRIVIFRSNKNFFAQLITKSGSVLVAFSSLSLKNEDKTSSKMTGCDVARIVGERFSLLCKKKQLLEDIVFDKSGYLYSGKVKIFADTCRKFGLKF